jgi:enoyl-CoA hydratase/carnithine racemase
MSINRPNFAGNRYFLATWAAVREEQWRRICPGLARLDAVIGDENRKGHLPNIPKGIYLARMSTPTQQQLSGLVAASRRDGVLLLTITRPEARNALNPAILSALAESLDAAGRDGATRAVVIAGGADFSAGADIDVIAGHNPASYLGSITRRAFEAIRRCELPIVAAVSGYCLGGGCELALSCDIVIAGDDAVFGQPEINLGIIPGAGGTQLWRERTGLGAQAEAALLGGMIDAFTARRIGLVDAVVPAERVRDQALLRAGRLAGKAPLAMRAAKAALRARARMALESALDHEVALMAGLLGTADAREGTCAFLEKRPPRYEGR